ncbi:MAG TPA: ATP-binding protein, partial [Candidatus Merdenecus merdavium]|nr:ATP-binding protein [Candidatus Merdenecus merdavium]
MIVGVFLRYFKTYQGINYIPITDEDQFCGLVGDNGIGKSSVLESLDCFFNGLPWTFHTATKKSGITTTSPYIIPVFLVKKDRFDKEPEVYEKASLISSIAFEISQEDVSPSTAIHMRKFIKHRELLIRNHNSEDYFLLPIGVDHSGNVSFSIFNSKFFMEKYFEGSSIPENQNTLTSEQLNTFKIVVDKLKETIEYIYIPREINPEDFTRLETNEIQVLM